MPRSWMPKRIAWLSNLHFYPSIRNNVVWKRKPPLCHPACPGVPWERTRISYFTALPAATYAALRKESRMKSTEATVSDRKSGAAEGPAVRPGSRTKVPVPSVLPKTRHPACPGLPWERSASQINRMTQPLWRGVEEPVLSVAEGTSAVLISPMLLRAFRPPKPDETRRSHPSFRPHNRFRNTLRTLHQYPVLGFQSSSGRNPAVSRDIE
jgi:hypothetical protein